jgi:hypothetical protein
MSSVAPMNNQKQAQTSRPNENAGGPSWWIILVAALVGQSILMGLYMGWKSSQASKDKKFI